MESAPIKIVIAEPDRFSPNALKKLKNLGEVILGPFNKEEFSEVCNDASVIVLRLQHYLDALFFQSAKRLKYIVTPTTGLNHIDEESASRNNVTIVSLKGEYEFLSKIPSTAEHSWALLLALVRHIPQAVTHVRELKWNRDLFIGRNLNQLKLGILGYGRVGEQMANFAKAFNMPFVSYDIDPEKNKFSHSVQNLETFLNQIDVLSIHIPLNEENRLFLNESNLPKLKKGAYIINTSRGEVMEENIVVRLLKAKHLKGVAADVLTDELDEGKRVKSVLLKYAQNFDNCIITPHIAGATIDSMQMTEEFVVAKLLEKWQ